MARQQVQAALGALQNATADVKAQIDRTKSEAEQRKQQLAAEISTMEKERVAALLIANKNETDTVDAVARNKIRELENRIDAANQQIKEIDNQAAEGVRNKETFLNEVTATASDVARLSGLQGVE